MRTLEAWHACPRGSLARLLVPGASGALPALVPNRHTCAGKARAGPRPRLSRQQRADVLTGRSMKGRVSLGAKGAVLAACEGLGGVPPVRTEALRGCDSRPQGPRESSSSAVVRVGLGQPAEGRGASQEAAIPTQVGVQT